MDFVVKFAARGSKMAWHTHPNACITCVGQGELREEVSEAEFVCRPGTALIKQAEARHRVVFPEDCTYLHLELPQDVAAMLEQPAMESALAVPALTEARLPGAMLPGKAVPGATLTDAPALTVARLQGELGRRRSSQLVLRGLIYQLIGEVNRLASSGSLPSWLAEARRLAETATGTEMSLGQIAATVDRHPAQVNRMFRRHFGCSVGEYQRVVRLRAAAELLQASAQPISKIATTLGFFDQSHFTRTFRKHFGAAPAQYRDQTKA